MEVKELIRKLANNDTAKVIFCTVKDVQKNTCTCEPIDGRAPFYNVRLNAGKENFCIVPTLNSIVAVSVIDNYNAFVSMFSEIDKIVLKNAKTIEIECEDVKIGTQTEKAVKGESLNSLLQEVINYLQMLNTALISYGTAQAAEFPLIAASNTALASALSSQTAAIASWSAKLQKHLSNILKIQ